MPPGSTRWIPFASSNVSNLSAAVKITRSEQAVPVPYPSSRARGMGSGLAPPALLWIPLHELLEIFETLRKENLRELEGLALEPHQFDLKGKDNVKDAAGPWNAYLAILK